MQIPDPDYYTDGERIYEVWAYSDFTPELLRLFAAVKLLEPGQYLIVRHNGRLVAAVDDPAEFGLDPASANPYRLRGARLVVPAAFRGGGLLDAGEADLVGTLVVIDPSFPAGGVKGRFVLTGAGRLAVPAAMPAGAFTVGGVTIGGRRFTAGPSFPGGLVGLVPDDEDWPDAFMSYESSEPITLTGVSNTTIEGYSFENLYWPQRPITLNNCHNITIRRVDSRRCSMGLVYAVNCTNITIEYCRAENITGPSERTGANRANFYQFNNVDGFHAHHLRGRYGDTEDVFSHYRSRNGVLEDVAWEGAIATNQPTSDGSASIPWRSGSGTGAICGDGGGTSSHDVTVQRATFLNPGQVGIAIAGGTLCAFEDCVVISTGNPPTRSVNVGAYVWNQYSGTCANHSMKNNRVKFHNNNHWWNGGNCGSIVTSGSVWGDNTLNPNDYRVVL